MSGSSFSDCPPFHWSPVGVVGSKVCGRGVFLVLGLNLKSLSGLKSLACDHRVFPLGWPSRPSDMKAGRGWIERNVLLPWL